MLMKKYKLKPINSYYHYKIRKLRMRRSLLALFIVGLISMALISSEKFMEDLGVSTTGKQVIAVDEPVYLDASQIKYELYSAPEDVRGIYIPASKVKNYEEYIRIAKETDINSFVIDIKNDYGYLTVDVENEALEAMGCTLEDPPISDIKKVISRLYEEGIYPIARIVAFKDSVVTQKFPERAVKDLSGNVYKTRSGEHWLDPYNKENWEYILEVSKYAIDLGFKEIQFDYIRFHESMNENTIRLDSNISKVDIITEFTRYICENLREYGAYVSADVFGAIILSEIDSETVGQDFTEMSKYLDAICPMVYPSHYAKGTFGIEYPHIDPYGIILKNMELAQDHIREIPYSERKVIIRPWLQDFTMKSLEPYLEYGPEQIREQIKATYDAGLNQWLFWNASGNYTVEGVYE